MNPYDEVAYRDRPHRLTHPDHLGALARLRGLDPAPAARARVLELGAGEGGNLVGMAVAAPDGEFTAVELAGAPVARGRRRIGQLGLRNLRLIQANLLEIDDALGPFDYVIAHGLYGWTPPDVSAGILAVASRVLAPHGVAFVSYNTQPFGHIRRLLRETMLQSAPRTRTPVALVAHARTMLGLLAMPRPDPRPLDVGLATEAGAVLEYDDAQIFHDFLAADYHPSSFADFVAVAARHGLQYLDDASVSDTFNVRLSPEALARAEALAGSDRIAHEQILDVLRARRFRQSIVCRAGLPVADDWQAHHAADLFVASNVREAEANRFVVATGATVTVSHEGLSQYLRHLIGLWPSAEQVGPANADAALALARRELVELRASPGAAGRAGERPRVSPLVLHQAQTGAREFFTLLHTVVEIANDEDRTFLQLVDGSRDRVALARDARCSAEELAARLNTLERHGLLVNEDRGSMSS